MEVLNISDKNKGFSLVELVIVIAIMAVIISILAPQFIRYVEKSKVGKDIDTVGVVQRAINVAMVDTSIADRPSVYSGHLANLETSSMHDFVKAIKEYMGAVDLSTFANEHLSSNAYKGNDMYIDIDAESELIRVTVSSNYVGMDAIVVE